MSQLDLSDKALYDMINGNSPVVEKKIPMMEMEEDEGEEEGDDEEEIDPSSVLGRLQAKMKMKKAM